MHTNDRSKSVSINNLFNIAQTARDWLQSIFCDSSFVWVYQVAVPVCTKRLEDKHYRLPDIDELVVVVNYETLWKSNPGEAFLRFYSEPLFFQKPISRHVNGKMHSMYCRNLFQKMTKTKFRFGILPLILFRLTKIHMLLF